VTELVLIGFAAAVLTTLGAFCEIVGQGMLFSGAGLLLGESATAAAKRGEVNPARPDSTS